MPRANRLKYIRPSTGRDGVVRYYLSRRGHRDLPPRWAIPRRSSSSRS
jgi:hypothetical protein